MDDSVKTKEFRIKRGGNILKYISRFSATEKVIFGILFAILLLSSLVLAFQASNLFVEDVPAYGGSLREGLIGLPRTINPVIAVTDVDKDISSLIYSGLVRYRDGVVVPDLAQSWVISDDGLTYTFNLKKNAKFQDGKIVTADDVAFTIQKIQNPAIKSPRHSDWSNVEVKVLSTNQIQFILKQPYSPFLSNTSIGIIPKHIWGSVSDSEFIFSQYNVEPIGSGPYKLESISRNSGGIPSYYKLSTWNSYSGKKPFIDNIYLHLFSDEAGAISALDSGMIDSLANISPENAVKLATNSGEKYKIVSSPLPRTFSAFFNQNQNPILVDNVVREALDISVDKNLIVKNVLYGYGLTLSGPFNNSVSSTTEFDLSNAMDMLEDAGWKKNSSGLYEKKTKTGQQLLSLTIFTADQPDLKEVAEIIKKSWATLGVKVDLKVFEASDLYQNIIRTRKYDVLVFGQFIGKDRDVYAFWHSSQRNYPGLNVSQYANPKVDKLLENIRTSNNDTEKKQMYEQLYNIIRQDNPAVFLYSPSFIYAVPKNLGGLKIESITIATDRWNYIENWFVNTDQVWKVITKIKTKLNKIINKISIKY